VVRRHLTIWTGPVMRVTSLDTPVPYAPTLEDHFLPNAKRFSRPRRNWRGIRILRKEESDHGR